jgi:hypothetical protein
MFSKGLLGADNREKGFVTYFQGANKDSLNTTTNQTTNFLNFKRKNKGWGSPVSIILGSSSHVPAPAPAPLPLPVQIDSPNSKSSWRIFSSLWESKSKKSTPPLLDSPQSLSDQTYPQRSSQSDAVDDIVGLNMTDAMVSGFAALINEPEGDSTISRTSSGNKSQRQRNRDPVISFTDILPVSPTVHTTTYSRYPSQKTVVESNEILLTDFRREERIQQRVDKISEVQETLSLLSRNLSNINELSLLNITPTSPLIHVPIQRSVIINTTHIRSLPSTAAV